MTAHVCATHGRLCAFNGEEPDRCQWCHVPWSSIVLRGPGTHSCESLSALMRAGVRPVSAAKVRAELAAAARQTAENVTRGARRALGQSDLPACRNGSLVTPPVGAASAQSPAAAAPASVGGAVSESADKVAP